MGLRLVVTSFNIRTASAPDGVQGWDFRKERVIERIRAADPDLLGLQECRADEQAEFIRSQLPDYAFLGVPRGGEGDSAREMAPVLYRRAAFEALGQGHFWLSATPRVPGSRAWGADYPRTATWVKLRPRAGGPPIVFLNTHFDYAGTAREDSARQLHAWVAALADRVVITGDFNAGRDSTCHRILTADGLVQDCLDRAGVTGGSFHDFGRATPEALDWILASPPLQPIRAGVDAWQDKGFYPSDHFPVTAELALPD